MKEAELSPPVVVKGGGGGRGYNLPTTPHSYTLALNLYPTTLTFFFYGELGTKAMYGANAFWHTPFSFGIVHSVCTILRIWEWD